MEGLKIWLLCIVSAILYGLVHDQVTIRVCPEYFTYYHPFLLRTDSLAVLALGWGIVATWWVGAGLGLLLAPCARWGRWPRLGAQDLVKPIGVLLATMALAAICAGLIGYRWGISHLDTPGKPGILPPAPFYADFFAHNASYLGGAIGGLILCVWCLVKRWRVEKESRASSKP